MEAALAERYPSRFRVRIADPFGPHTNALLQRIVALYSPLVRHTPPVWGTLYHATNSRPVMAALVRAYAPLVGRTLMQMLTDQQPCLVASFHPLTNHVTARLLGRRLPGVPLITVVTDLVNFHVGWVARAADLIVVPSREAQDLCHRRGMARDRVLRLGLPIHPRFARALAEPTDRDRGRAALGLEEEGFCVLLAGGAEGAGHLWRKARALARSRLPLQLALVCGRNARLQQRARTAAWEVPVRVFGFVQEMPQVMRACDLIVTKAGPGTVSEALAMGLPVVLTSYLPGQEAGNVEYVLQQGAGRFASGSAELVRAVRDLLALTPDEWEALRARARAAAEPRAAYAIADLIARQVADHVRPRLGTAI